MLFLADLNLEINWKRKWLMIIVKTTNIQLSAQGHS
jgi:hypothetical protein